MKITIVGSGSTYTPELIEGILNLEQSLNAPDIFFYDIDKSKLEIVSDFSRKMATQAGSKCNMTSTMDLTEALDGADFVLSQLRVGGMAARITDEKIPLKHNLLGQETVGIGGFFNALRTIPVILDIADKMEELCPKATLINFANPAGMVTQAVSDYSNIRIYGVCNNPFNMKKSITEKLGLTNPSYDYIGLNHLSWITGIYENGESYMDKALAEGINSETMKNIPKGEFSADLISAIKGIPSSYLRYVYKKNESLELAKNAEKTRAQCAFEIETQLLEIYKDENVKTKPEALSMRGGANYSFVAITLLDAIYNNKSEPHVINLPNEGSVDFLAQSDVLETTAIIGKDGAKRIPLSNVSDHIKGVIQTFKQYENFAVKAAVSGNRDTAIYAMLANPLIYDYDAATACFDEMFEVNKKYLSKWT